MKHATSHRCLAPTQQTPLYPPQHQHSPWRSMIATISCCR
jgi:hypothetical protein